MVQSISLSWIRFNVMNKIIQQHSIFNQMDIKTNGWLSFATDVYYIIIFDLQFFYSAREWVTGRNFISAILLAYKWQDFLDLKKNRCFVDENYQWKQSFETIIPRNYLHLLQYTKPVLQPQLTDDTTIERP